jgi:gamma-glutamylcyclotransferase (GGCT)/AIG2-like uncharacterized protein YtfP
MEKDYLFVYGNEKRRGADHSLLEKAEFVGEAAIHGTLYDLGIEMPGVVEGARGLVHGELYLAGGKILAELDSYAGADPKVPDSVFARTEVEAILADRSKVRAWAYLLTDEKLQLFFAFPLKEGKWN